MFSYLSALSVFARQALRAHVDVSATWHDGVSMSDRTRGNTLILGHSFVAGFKEFLQEDPTRHNLKLNLSTREFMIQFSGRRGASIYRIRSDLEIVADFQPHVCILQAGTNDIGAKPKHMKDADWEEHVARHLYALAVQKGWWLCKFCIDCSL